MKSGYGIDGLAEVYVKLRKRVHKRDIKFIKTKMND